MEQVSVWHLVVLVLLVGIGLAPVWIGWLVLGRQRALLLQHPATGLQKPGYYGFCTPYFFFGFLVPIFRGEIVIGMLHLVFSVVTGGLFQVIMAYLYNRQFTTRQMMAGWEIVDRDHLGEGARRSLRLAAPARMPAA